MARNAGSTPHPAALDFAPAAPGPVDDNLLANIARLAVRLALADLAAEGAARATAPEADHARPASP